MDAVSLYWVCMVSAGIGLIALVVAVVFYRDWRDSRKPQHQGNPYIQSVFQPRYGSLEKTYQKAARDAREDNLSQIVAGVIVAEMMINTANNISALGNQNQN
jgi:hypothetical protein